MNKIQKILVCLTLFLLTACQNRDMLDLQQFVESAQNQEKSDIEPLPVPKPHPTYSYSASDESDPFDVTNIAKQEEPEYLDPRNTNRRKEELEGFPLDGIKLVGTVALKGEPWAILNAPDGTIHRVKRGRYLGENDGRIASIDLDEQKLTLVEDVESATGEWIKREVFLSIDDE